MSLIKIAGKSFLIGDVVKVECSDDTVKIIRIESVLDDRRFKYWDILSIASWEGTPGIRVGEMDLKDVRTARKVSNISDQNRDAYVKFAMMYHRMRDWEKLL